MANDISTKIKIEGDKEYKQSIQNITQAQKTLKAEMEAVDKQYAKSESAEAKAAAKKEVLNKAIENQKKAIDTLKKKYDEQVQTLGKNDTATLKTEQSLHKAEAALYDYENQLTDLVGSENEATDATDEFGEEAQDTADDLEEAEKEASKFSETLKSGLIQGAKLAAEAIGALAIASVAALAKLTTESIKGFSEYEKLEGGSKKLFGTAGQSIEEYAETTGKSVDEVSDEYKKLQKAEKTVLQNSSDAWKTVGMDQNTYLQSVTAFSASLINSFGGDTVAAAEAADMAMRDIADNANTFGTQSAEELTQVYQALAKGQFSTLDNLNLGFGGTKEGMEALIKKANELKEANGELGDLSIDSFGDMVEAIHLVQNQMKITGTTSREAMTTIQGSINATKAAWKNFVAGLANDNADIDQLINDLVEAAGAAADNIIPRINVVLDHVAEAIPPLIDKIIQEIPTWITSIANGLEKTGLLPILDAIAKAAPSLIDTAVGLIETILPELLNKLPEFAKTGAEMLTVLIEGLAKITPDLIPSIVECVVQICEALLSPESLLQLTNAASELIVGLVNGLADASTLLIDCAPALVDGFTEATIILIENLPDIAANVIDGLLENLKSNAETMDMTSVAETILRLFADSMYFAIPGVGAIMSKVANSLIDLLFPKGSNNNATKAGSETASSYGKGFGSSAKKVGEQIVAFAKGVTSGLDIDATQQGKKTGDSYSSGIDAAKSIATASARALASSASSALYDSSSYSKGYSIGSTFSSGISATNGSAYAAGSGLASNAKSGATISLYSSGYDAGSSFASGLNASSALVLGAATAAAQIVANNLHFSVPKEGPLSDFDETPKDMMLLLANGIRENVPILEKALHESLDIIPAFAPAIYQGAPQMTNETMTFTTPMINIYAAAGQSPDDIADAVMSEIQNAVDRKGVFR